MEVNNDYIDKRPIDSRQIKEDFEQQFKNADELLKFQSFIILANMTKKGIIMQNLKNIKSLNNEQIQNELNQIISFFEKNNFDKNYIQNFRNVCKVLIGCGNNKVLDFNSLMEVDKPIILEFESYLNIKYMNRS